MQAFEYLAIEVAHEVERAMSIHKPMNSLHEGKAVIEEEFDELWTEIKKNPKKMTDEERFHWKEKLREEAIQTSAMCMRLVLDVIDKMS